MGISVGKWACFVHLGRPDRPKSPVATVILSRGVIATIENHLAAEFSDSAGSQNDCLETVPKRALSRPRKKSIKADNCGNAKIPTLWSCFPRQENKPITGFDPTPPPRTWHHHRQIRHCDMILPVSPMTRAITMTAAPDRDQGPIPINQN